MRITFELDEREREEITAALLNALNGVKADFTPPTLEDVQAYADAQGWERRLFEPAEFYRYNTLRGWPMKDWKLAAAGWYSKEKRKRPELARQDFSEWEG